MSTTLGSNKALLDFYADWCQPCKQMAPTIADLKKEFAVTEINVDEDPAAEHYGVMSVPTYIVLDEDGEETHRFVGFTKKEILQEALRK